MQAEIILLPILLLIIVGGVTSALAARKGYSGLIWFFAAGVIGLIVLAFLPFTNTEDLSRDVAEAKRKVGNVLGGTLAGLGLFIGLLRLLP